MVNNLWAKQNKMMTLFFPFLQHKIVVFPHKLSSETGGFLAANTDTYLVTLLGQSSLVHSSCRVLYIVICDFSPIIAGQRPTGSQAEVILSPLQGTHQVLHAEEGIFWSFNDENISREKPAGQSHSLAKLDSNTLRLAEELLSGLG